MANEQSKEAKNILGRLLQKHELELALYKATGSPLIDALRTAILAIDKVEELRLESKDYENACVKALNERDRYRKALEKILKLSVECYDGSANDEIRKIAKKALEVKDEKD